MIIIKVENNIKLFINKCIKENINLLNIEYKEKYLLVTINEKDYTKIKKLNYLSKIKIYKYLGKKELLKKIKLNSFNIFILLLFILLIFMYSNFIIKIEIKHENKQIKTKIKQILKDNGIKEYTLKKSNKELNEISDNILKNNREFLDFISITRNGMQYEVNIETRIIKKEKLENKKCHIISNKEGIINKIIVKNGVKVVEENTLVKQGDILISGEYKLNEEIKEDTCAKGEIRANTWYKINIIYPLNKIEKKYTKREKINIKIYDKYLKKVKYNKYEEDKILKIKNIKIVKQKEYIEINKKIGAKKAKEEAINEAIHKLKQNIGNNIKIMNKKVLKESTFNSKIELEIFVSIDEPIGKTYYYERSGENDNTKDV